MQQFSKWAQKKIGKTMREFNRGTLRSGKGRTKVKTRAQAIAIGIAQVRERRTKVVSK